MEPTTTTPTDTTESDGLFVRAWRRIWAVWTMTVRMYVVVAVVGIGVIVNYGIKENLKAVDERQRAADARDAALIAYTAQLRTHDLEVRERDDCLTDVARADDNRGQHEALVAALERLFPDSQLTADLVAELRAGPLLSAEPRSIADCPAPPVAPVIPPELIGASS